MRAQRFKTGWLNHSIILSVVALSLAGGLASCSQHTISTAEQTARSLPPASASSETSEGFTLGPEDEINISVWRQDDMQTTTTIDPSGHIDMPLIGRVKAAGLTPSELARSMEAKLASYLYEPKVTVSVSNVSSRNIYVLGEVNNPGMFAMSDNMSAWEAIAKAGGFSDDADQNRLVIVRERVTPNGTQALAEGYSLAAISKTGKKPVMQPPKLANRDIIYVPPSGIAKVSNLMSRIETILRPVLSSASVIVLSDSAYDVFFPKAEKRQTQQAIAISPR